MKHQVVACFGVGLLLSFVQTGCLTRDVVEAQPQTSNLYVKPIENSVIDKIDLLFVVDNSPSMADKQAILGRAIPQMLERLIRPDCVRRDELGVIVERVERADVGSGPSCLQGWGLEFEPVNDIHIGVISSSLGGHGSSECPRGPKNDRALLMPKVRSGIPDPHGTGYLVWHRPQADDAPGTLLEDDLDRLEADFRAHVLAAGEEGCGFEAPLEAWYRFLVDPSPPRGMQLELDPEYQVPIRSFSTGVDHEVLDQRAAFLRHDSLVAVVVLTDENDCSAMEGGNLYPMASSGWMLSEHREDILLDEGFPRATAACDENPNDPCCFSCFLTELPAGCDNPESLKSCTSFGQPRLDKERDRAGVRCFDNQRRFGIDLLYPIERYIKGLSEPHIVDSQTGTVRENPLLLGVDGRSPRPPGQVFFAGITGVPFQDIADPAKDAANQLRYLSAPELRQGLPELGGQDRWSLILGQRKPGDAAPPQPPLDPFMVESIAPRSGVHPLLGVSPRAYPSWNEINGNEQNNQVENQAVGGLGSEPANDDLQYSCVFPLAPYDAVETCDPDVNSLSCDCSREPNKNSPVCRSGPDGAATTTQHFGKAYPSTRVLEVLRGFGDNSIVASICPKVHDPSERDFGFNPAVSAIVDVLGKKLGGQCLPRPLVVDADGNVECKVFEALPAQDAAMGCEAQGRSEVAEKLQAAAMRQLEAMNFCVGSGCEDVRLCEVKQHEGDARNQCLQAPRGAESELEAGYCYVDPQLGLGDASLVASCPPSERRLLRFVGKETPRNGAVVLVGCAGGVPSVVSLGHDAP